MPRLPERLALEARWLELTRIILPSLASSRGWPISADHCFQRVLLDNVAGRCWYDVVAKRPAYRHAPENLLKAAIALGEKLATDDADLAVLNRRSLMFRGKMH